jgi:hypothetical protein
MVDGNGKDDDQNDDESAHDPEAQKTAFGEAATLLSGQWQRLSVRRGRPRNTRC